MKTSITKTMKPIDRFFYWVKERHDIYLRKEAGDPKPWTDDEVLQSVFFTNPFRENDKVTKWIHKNIRIPYANHPYLWFMLAIARQINRPETLQEMIDHGKGAWPNMSGWKEGEAVRVLHLRQQRGLPVYTGAYMIRAESNPNAPWYHWTKVSYTCRIVLGRLWELRKRYTKLLEREDCTIQEATEWLHKDKFLIGWGPFMAYEVTSDLAHTRYLRDAPDIFTWANPGPGAFRGLNWVLGESVGTRRRSDDAVAEMRNLLEEWKSRFPNGISHQPHRPTMREVEHSLCEFDKYNRALFKTGRLKRMYDGKGWE